TKDEPVKFADDAMNSLMMVTQVWGPRATPLTERERRELEYPEHLRLANAPPYGTGWARDGFELGRMVWMETAKRRKEMSGGGRNWTHNICSPDDPWNPKTPLEDTEDDPWRGGE